MMQPVSLWGLPRLAELPPDRRKLILERCHQLTYRNWHTRIAVAVLLSCLLAAFPLVMLGLPLDPVLGGLLLGLLPAFILQLIITPGMRKSYRLALAEHGFCLRCGYNLTGNTSGACSECGEALPIEGRVTA